MLLDLSPLTGVVSSFFFFNDTATTEIYTLSLHDALPICACRARRVPGAGAEEQRRLPRLRRRSDRRGVDAQRPGAASPAQRADAADAGPRLRQGVSLRPRLRKRHRGTAKSAGQ